jgi:hypothetical protein
MSSDTIKDRFTAEREADDRAALGGLIAQVTCGLLGLSLVLAGILGFIFGGTDFGTGNPQGDDLIIFEVNGWHNVVHVLTGLLLLAAAPRAPLAIAGLLVFAGGYAAVTIWGFIDGDDVVGLLAIDMADNFLHLALTLLPMGAAALAAGLYAWSQQRRQRADRG